MVLQTRRLINPTNRAWTAHIVKCTPRFPYTKSGAFTTLLAILCFSIISCSSGNAASDAYKPGYKNGCDDAGILEKADRYINKPEAEPSLNSDEFMHGYNDGFDACSSSNYNSNMEDQNFAKKMCEEFGYLCQRQDKKCNVYDAHPGLRDLLYRLECEIPFLFGENNTNSKSS
jgi:hypothetical protein